MRLDVIPMKHGTKHLLNSDWLSYFSQCNKLFVGFSGGLDSTVLLHLLASFPELQSKLLALHINHGISPNALCWQKHCELLCQSLGIEFITEAVCIDSSANIEKQAREARYAVFSSLLTENDCLILAHHQDDQAETVLLQLFRGAGIDGLAAMLELGRLGTGHLARPLLSSSRAQLEQYAALHQLSFIQDESNQDVHYSRNYLRHEIIPLLAERWPGVVGNIARTAKHQQQAKINLDALAVLDVIELLSVKNSLFIEPLLHLGRERIANILKVWLRNNEIQAPTTAIMYRLIDEIIFARSDALPEVRWGDVIVRRYKKHVYLTGVKQRALPISVSWTNFPSPLVLKEASIHLVAKKAHQGLVVPQGAQIDVKFRRGGELFHWHGQTKHLKKLFQEWEIPPWLREKVPLLYINNQLALVVGFAVSDSFYNESSPHAWLVLA